MRKFRDLNVVNEEVTATNKKEAWIRLFTEEEKHKQRKEKQRETDKYCQCIGTMLNETEIIPGSHLNSKTAVSS